MNDRAQFLSDLEAAGVAILPPIRDADDARGRAQAVARALHDETTHSLTDHPRHDFPSRRFP